jgi:hypothetical protein
MYFWHLFIGYNKFGREFKNLVRSPSVQLKYDGFAICVGDNNAITL